MKHTIAIIIVNWNGKKDTLDCLASLKKLDTKGHDLYIVVVDNGSVDGSKKAIAEKHPDVHIVSEKENTGFAKGNNIGMTYGKNKACPDFIWLLNNDTLVERNALSLLDVFDNPSVGAAGSKIYFAPGSEYHKKRYTKKERGNVIWFAGGCIDWKNMICRHRGVDEVDRGQYEKIVETQFITGCSLMMRADIVERVGLFDERYYLYLEDVDYCLRMQQYGFKTLYVPSSVIWHKNASSTGIPGNPKQDYYLTRNRFLLGFSYGPWRTKIALFRQALTYLFGRNPVRRKAVCDLFTGRLGNQYE